MDDLDKTLGSKEEPPSKVIHIRNVVPEIQEEDLRTFCGAFGAVKSLVMMRSKNQALVQMEEMSAAVNLVMRYRSTQAKIKGRNVYPRFSTHMELTGQQSKDAAPNRILLITIHNPVFTINVDIMYQVFSPYGTIEKVVIFKKTAGTRLQCLIQYNDVQGAVQAKSALNNQTLYTGSFSLEIQFSNLQHLTVNANNDMTRDFLNPNLPSESGKNKSDALAAQAALAQSYYQAAALYPEYAAYYTYLAQLAAQAQAAAQAGVSMQDQAMIYNQALMQAYAAAMPQMAAMMPQASAAALQPQMMPPLPMSAPLPSPSGPPPQLSQMPGGPGSLVGGPLGSPALGPPGTSGLLGTAPLGAPGLPPPSADGQFAAMWNSNQYLAPPGVGPYPQ